MILLGMDIIPIPGFAEPFSCLSHLLAAPVFLVLSVPLLRRGRGRAGRMISLGVFAFGCVFLLSISGVYHLLSTGGAGREVLRRLDHAAIFFLIAATFTPAHGILFRGIWRWGMLTVIWAAAITGLTLKTIFFHGVSEGLGLTFYLGLGWVGVISGIAIWMRFGPALVRPLVAGALAYTFGALFEFAKWPVLVEGVIGPHEMFHVAVIVGIGCHWWFVYRFAGGPPDPPRAEKPNSAN
ncbi:MAG: hemolysin III family protein [Phycisphaerae bacterium]|nr:hemolysin III family protein [Phycisphaerae bacterium]